MSQGFFNLLKKSFPHIDNAYEAISFGTNISDVVNPKIIEPCKKLGLNLDDKNNYYPKTIDDLKIDLKNIERIYTCGCMANTCDLSDGLKIYDDLNLEDPAKENVNIDEIISSLISKILVILNELNK